MTIRTSLGSLALSFVAMVGIEAQAPDVPAATAQHGGFGLPDQSGGRLLVIPNLARPESLKAALCAGGRGVPVQFERRQVEATHNGRQTSSNFDKLAGSVFTILGNKVDPGTTCFLASETLLAGGAGWSLSAPAGPGACARRDRFAEVRSRRVTNCWPLARMATDKEVVLLEFERRGTQALASFVVVDGTRTMFADVTAEFQGEGQSLWRVDDDGKLSPQGIDVVCVVQRGNWYALATAWAGAEGRLLSLWIAEGSDRLTKVINDYWYQAPI